MSKKNFVSLVLGTLGGMLFALGMCMALIPQWNSFKAGVIMGAVSGGGNDNKLKHSNKQTHLCGCTEKRKEACRPGNTAAQR